MTDNKRLRALLLINIPTHTRHMLQVAELMEKSGRYEPIVVFYPAVHYFAVESEIARIGCEVVLLDDTHFKWLRVAPRLDVHDRLPEEPRAPPDWREMALEFALRPDIWDQGRWDRVILRHPILDRRWVKETAARAVVMARRARRLASWVAAFSYVSVTTTARRTTLLASSKSDLASRGILRRAAILRFAQIWNSDDRFSRSALPKKKLYETVGRLFDQIEPQLTLLPEDNLYYFSYFFIKHSINTDKPSAIVPYTIVNTKEWAENHFLDCSNHVRKGLSRLLASAFPEWTIRHKGRRLILPTQHILIAEHLGVAPRIPWLINSGHATAIAAEGQFMRDYYVAAGIAPEKLCVTGALSDDVLTDRLKRRPALRAELHELYGVSPEKPLMLLALPPNQIPGGPDGRPGFEFDDYRGLVTFIAAEMAAQSAHFAFAVNLHPRVEAKAVSDIFASHGIPIVPRPIEELVPLCDLYVASVSATIRLALNCGIPVVNYDAYHYEYDDYTGQPGILTMQKASEFAAVLQRLTTDASFFQVIKTAQEAAAKNYAVLDGRSGTRVLALFDRLTGTKTASASHG